jgi:hypothetical protein
MNCDSVKSGNNHGRFPIHKEFIIFWVWNISDWLQLINVHRKRKNRIERGRRRKVEEGRKLIGMFLYREKKFLNQRQRKDTRIPNPEPHNLGFYFYFFSIRKINNCFEIISN